MSDKHSWLMYSKMRYYHLWLGVGWILLVVVVFLSLTTNPPALTDIRHADKLEHLLAYSILMGWFAQLANTIRIKISLVIGLCLMGILLEYLQGWSGYRDFEYADMAADTAGIFLGWWVSSYLLRGWLYRFDKFISGK